MSHNEPEPRPVIGEKVVGEFVLRDIEERMQLGKEKYGTYLMTKNGRNPLVDLYQELLDGAFYVKQKLLEEESQQIKCGEDNGESGIRIKIKPVPPVDLERSPWTKPEAERGEVRPAPAQEQGEALVRRISAELHRLPKNNKGHEIGMMEVGYDSNGQLNYGPLWLSVDETDAILLGIYRALLARKPAEERGPEVGECLECPDRASCRCMR